MVIDGATPPCWQSESLLTKIGKDPGPRIPILLLHTHTLTHTYRHTHTHIPGHSFLSRGCSISPYSPSPALRDRSSRSPLQRGKVRDGFQLGLVCSSTFVHILYSFLFICRFHVPLHFLPPPLVQFQPSCVKMQKQNAPASLQHDLVCVSRLTPGPLLVEITPGDC